MSLRARLFALVLLATLLPMLLVSLRFVRDSDTEVQGTAQLEYGLARARAMDRALQDSDRNTCSAFLANVREAYPQYTGILNINPDGTMFCDSLRTGRQLNLLDRPYFQRALTTSGVTVEPACGRLTGLPVLQIVYPARNDAGALRFMLVASLNLQKFVLGSSPQALSSVPQQLLLDRTGQVLVAGNTGLMPATSITGTPLFALAQAQPEGGMGELPDAKGQAQVWAVAGHASARNAGL